jgi:DNA-binding HxlR family transcriptional regulator
MLLSNCGHSRVNAPYGKSGHGSISSPKNELDGASQCAILSAMNKHVGFCPIAKALEILGDRWTFLIIREVICASHRFTDLYLGLPGIPRSLLVQRLRSLERAGVIERRVDGKRIEYHLTEKPRKAQCL